MGQLRWRGFEETGTKVPDSEGYLSNESYFSNPLLKLLKQLSCFATYSETSEEILFYLFYSTFSKSKFASLNKKTTFYGFS